MGLKCIFAEAVIELVFADCIQIEIETQSRELSIWIAPLKLPSLIFDRESCANML